MESIRLELKYCEGCGTLKLRPAISVTSRCRVCEDMLERFHFPKGLMKRHQQKIAANVEMTRIPRAALPHGNLPTGSLS